MLDHRRERVEDPDGHPPLGAKRWGPGVSSDTLDDGTTEHIDGGDRRLVRREMPGIAVTPAALPPAAGWKLCTRPKRHGKGTIGSAVEARRQRVRRHLRRPHARGGEPLGKRMPETPFVLPPARRLGEAESVNNGARVHAYSDSLGARNPSVPPSIPANGSRQALVDLALSAAIRPSHERDCLTVGSCS